MKKIVITGTDTEIGKTTFSSALMLGLEKAKLNPHYWKPIQSGIDEGVDTRIVQKNTLLPENRFLPESYIFSESLSPHRAAEIDGKNVDFQRLSNKSSVPECEGVLVIEGAGGLMVPLTYRNLQIDMYKAWNFPVILCARSGLGTINHTILSIEALENRRITVAGVVFIGNENPDNISAIKSFSNVKILGTMPKVESFEPEILLGAFVDNFNIQDFIL